jgi:hypothetical protein
MRRKNLKNIWKTIAWLFIICGIICFFIGWIGAITNSNILGIDTNMYFYDAIATGIFGLYFLLYAIHSEGK